MANNCKDDQIRRDGTGQAQRFLQALDTSRNLIDDRNPEDLLVFAKHYAELVRFYDAGKPVDLENSSLNENDKAESESSSKAIENWKEFFTKDIATLIASIAQYKNRLDWLRQEFEDKRKKTDEKPTVENYRDLFISIIDHLIRFNKWYIRGTADHPLKNELEIKIHSTLSPALQKLIAFGKGYSVLNEGKLGLRNHYTIFKEPPWNIKYDEIDADVNIYAGNSRQKKISHAALFIDDIFLTILKTYKELTGRTDFYYTSAIENYPEHQPHMALFIAFIELFSYAQKELNSITGRHLEFYYRDVLHLNERPANPDAVYLIYELAKEATEYDLKEGTPLTAGKDALGKELIYKTENELVINKAKVKELKTVFQKKNIEGKTDAEKEKIINIYSSPVANSQDGNGTPFKVPETAWPALGYFKSGTDTIGKEAEMGFAISSPQLFLAEGLRKIVINLPLNDLPPDGDLTALSKSLEIRATSEKGWMIINQNQISTNDNDLRFSLTENVITINIPASQQSIVAYDKIIHGEGYDTTFPVIKFILKDSSMYDTLKNKFILVDPKAVSKINITVEVKGIKNLFLENDLNAFDPTKEITPFTQSPKKGHSFYIGNREVFFKQLKNLSIKFDILEEITFPKPGQSPPGTASSANPAKINAAILNDKDWKYILTNTEKNVFAFRNSIEFLTDTIQLNNHREVDYSNYSSKETSRSGFMKIDLINEIDATIKFDDNKRTLTLPQTFIIKNVELNYTSSQDFEAAIEQYFHIYPFGVTETFPKINIPSNLPYTDFTEYNKAKNNLVIESAYLLPQIKFGSDNANLNGHNQYFATTHQQGNLYIGIESLILPQNLSLLFKIADGTAEDNDSEPPTINWSYLVHNEWRPLPVENIISDSTYGLQTTGIVLIDLPKEATTDSTIITQGLHWLAASVDKDADKIPKIIDIVAQANKAVFLDQENDPEHYRIPLPAKTIAKLVTKIPEIKLVTQPFESFERKMREEGKVFYARASERLRHKHRAITPWDYEHLVLQHFPWIYKVKCLSNTDPECLCRHVDNVESNPCCCAQIAPGHVLIIPVSNLRNKNAVDILKPRTGRRTLIQIEEYLKKLTSPFVHVHAKNPLFEEIKTVFKVKFHTGTDKGRYLQQLNNDIIKYLTPWAFDETNDVVFGGKVYASNIINFIEEQEYVDYIACFRIIHIVNDCCEKDSYADILCPDLQRTDYKKKPDSEPDEQYDKDKKITDRFVSEIEATSSRAILTSVKKHCIEPIDEPKKKEDCNCS